MISRYALRRSLFLCSSNTKTLPFFLIVDSVDVQIYQKRDDQSIFIVTLLLRKGIFAETIINMEDQINMEDIDRQKVPTARDAFMKRFSEKYPDFDPNDEEGLYGKLGEEFDRFDRSDTAQRELGELLAKDPRSAGFLMVLRKGGNPMEFMIEQYGDDFREALNDPEKAKELAGAFLKYAEKQAKNKELQKQAEDNLQKMLDELDAAQEDGNFSDEDATNAYEFLYADGGLLDRIITNDITKEDWMMLMKASNYDNLQKDLESKVVEARNEGEITGRNAKIEEAKRKRTKVDSMPSQIASTSTPVGGKAKNPAVEALDKITSKSVWD